MKIIITENQKKKLFTPKGLSDDLDNRYLKLNQEQPIKIIGGEEIRINQYDLDGNKTGYWEDYWDGKLWTKGNYIGGKKEGIWETYHQNGNLQTKGNYVNGEAHGYCEIYNTNGELYSKGRYDNGYVYGTWNYYNNKGEIRNKKIYSNGKLVKVVKIMESEHPKKKIFTPKNLSNDENNRFIQWNKEQPIRDGKRINQYDVDGRKQGYWESYQFIGDGNRVRILRKGNYKDGYMVGVWDEFYDNGQLRSSIYYVNGKKDGLWELYRQNGELFFRGKN